MSEQSKKQLTSTFPNLKTIFIEAWELVKQKAFDLFALQILAFVAIILWAFLGGLVLLLLGVLSVGVMQSAGILSLVTLLLLVIVASVWIIGIISIGYSVQAGQMLALDTKEGTTTYEFFKKGFSFVWPIFTTVAISLFFIIGGLMLFLIPGLIISVFLSFMLYEVVLGGVKNRTALRNSVSMIQQNFGNLFIAVLVYLGIVMLASYTVSAIFSSGNSLNFAAVMVQVLLQIFIAMYTVALYYKLYQHARATTKLDSPSTLKWFWVIAVVGWVIGILLIVAGTSVASEALRNPQIRDAFQKEFQEEFQKEMMKDGYKEDRRNMMRGETEMEDFDMQEFEQQMDQFEKELNIDVEKDLQNFDSSSI